MSSPAMSQYTDTRPLRASASAVAPKVLVACGAAAGMASAYNAPIGGAMFAIAAPVLALDRSLSEAIGQWARVGRDRLPVVDTKGTGAPRRAIGRRHLHALQPGELRWRGAPGALRPRRRRRTARDDLVVGRPADIARLGDPARLAQSHAAP